MEGRDVFSLPFFVKQIPFVALWNHILFIHIEFMAGRESPCVTVLHTRKNLFATKIQWKQKAGEKDWAAGQSFPSCGFSSCLAGVCMHNQLNAFVDYFCIVPKY